ncbi:MAG: hypothetical protein H3C48_06545 [Chitinophagaceae bacterium]|nr:hypothetical protein [Chitinophagaceae bacterium]
MKSKRQTLIIAVLLTIFFMVVSTPWEFGLSYFGDSTVAWVLYYIIGFIISLYVTYAFLRALIMLVNHTCEQFKEINNGL